MLRHTANPLHLNVNSQRAAHFRYRSFLGSLFEALAGVGTLSKSGLKESSHLCDLLHRASRGGRFNFRFTKYYLVHTGQSRQFTMTKPVIGAYTSLSVRPAFLLSPELAGGPFLVLFTLKGR